METFEEKLRRLTGSPGVGAPARGEVKTGFSAPKPTTFEEKLAALTGTGQRTTGVSADVVGEQYRQAPPPVPPAPAAQPDADLERMWNEQRMLDADSAGTTTDPVAPVTADPNLTERWTNPSWQQASRLSASRVVPPSVGMVESPASTQPGDYGFAARIGNLEVLPEEIPEDPSQIPWQQLLGQPGFTPIAALGMSDPETARTQLVDYLNQRRSTLSGKTSLALKSGEGSTTATVGSTMKWLGTDRAPKTSETDPLGSSDFSSLRGQRQPEPGIADALIQTGKARQQKFAVPRKQYKGNEWLWDPEFYALGIAESAPTTVPLIAMSILSGFGGAALAGAAGAGPTGTAVIGALSSGIPSRVMEGAMEAGGVYDEALNGGMTEEQAANAASEVFWKNQTLAGADAAQFAMAFAKIPAPLKKTLSKALTSRMGRVGLGAARVLGTATSEAAEEGLQDIFQRQALGKPVNFDTELQQAMAIGGVFGGGMAIGGALGGVDAEPALTQQPPAPPQAQTQPQAAEPTTPPQATEPAVISAAQEVAPAPPARSPQPTAPPASVPAAPAPFLTLGKALDRTTYIRQLNPALDERAIQQMVLDTARASDEEFQVMAQRQFGQTIAAQPATPPVQPSPTVSTPPVVQPAAGPEAPLPGWAKDNITALKQRGDSLNVRASAEAAARQGLTARQWANQTGTQAFGDLLDAESYFRIVRSDLGLEPGKAAQQVQPVETPAPGAPTTLGDAANAPPATPIDRKAFLLDILPRKEFSDTRIAAILIGNQDLSDADFLGALRRDISAIPAYARASALAKIDRIVQGAAPVTPAPVTPTTPQDAGTAIDRDALYRELYPAGSDKARENVVGNVWPKYAEDKALLDHLFKNANADQRSVILKYQQQMKAVPAAAPATTTAIPQSVAAVEPTPAPSPDKAEGVSAEAGTETIADRLGGQTTGRVGTLTVDGEELPISLRPDNSTPGTYSVVVHRDNRSASYRLMLKRGTSLAEAMARFEEYMNVDNPGRYKATADPPRAVTEKPELDPLQQKIKDLESKKYKTGPQEALLKRLKAAPKNWATRWTPGDGVSFYVSGGMSKGWAVQSIRGHEATLVTVRDVGQTTDGSDDPGIGHRTTVDLWNLRADHASDSPHLRQKPETKAEGVSAGAVVEPTALEKATKEITRKGTAAIGDIAVKVVVHPSGQGYGVEVTVKGDRRPPIGPSMTLQEARSAAVEALNPVQALSVEATAEPTTPNQEDEAQPQAEKPVSTQRAQKKAAAPSHVTASVESNQDGESRIVLRLAPEAIEAWRQSVRGRKSAAGYIGIAQPDGSEIVSDGRWRADRMNYAGKTLRFNDLVSAINDVARKNSTELAAREKAEAAAARLLNDVYDAIFEPKTALKWTNAAGSDAWLDVVRADTAADLPGEVRRSLEQEGLPLDKPFYVAVHRSENEVPSTALRGYVAKTPAKAVMEAIRHARWAKDAIAVSKTGQDALDTLAAENAEIEAARERNAAEDRRQREEAQTAQQRKQALIAEVVNDTKPRKVELTIHTNNGNVTVPTAWAISDAWAVHKELSPDKKPGKQKQTEWVLTHRPTGFGSGIPGTRDELVALARRLDHEIPELASMTEIEKLKALAKRIREVYDAHQAGKPFGKYGVAEVGKAPSQPVKERLREKVETVEGKGAAEEAGSLALRVFPGGRAPAAETGSVDVPITNPESEARWQAADKGPAVATRWENVKETIRSGLNKMTREFEYLPRIAKFAQLRSYLHKFLKGEGIASDQAVRYLQGITVGLSRKNGEYNLFRRHVVYSDMMEDLGRVEGDIDPDMQLAYGLTPGTLREEFAKVKKAVQGNEKVKQAVEDRKAVQKELADRYIAAYTAVNGKAPPINRENYFHHQIISYMNAEGNRKGGGGTTTKLRAPNGRGWLKVRKGSAQDFSNAYLEVEHKVLSQMLFDTTKYELIVWLRDSNLNTMADVLADAQAKGEKDWRKLVPNGFTVWSPKGGSQWVKESSVPVQVADDIMRAGLQDAGLDQKTMDKIMYGVGKRIEMVLPTEVAATLDQIGRMPEKASTWQKITGMWKKQVLLFPTRVIKYNVRNISGDLDAVLAGNPATLRKVPKAVSELYQYLINGGAASADLEAWMDEGGIQDTFNVADKVSNINALKQFQQISNQSGVKKALTALWNLPSTGSNFREYILRYAAFLSYKEQMTKSGGRPANYGASIKEEIDALTDTNTKAYKLSNDLLGAYDEVTVFGQWLRQGPQPFWSFTETNMRRYYRMFKNAFADGNTTTVVGRTVALKVARLAVKSPVIAYRLGKFVMRAAAFSALLAAWNYLRFPDEEEELSAEVRARPHIIFGRDEKGDVKYFTRLGAVGEFLEWFGFDEDQRRVKAYLDGTMTFQEVAVDIAQRKVMSPVNKLAQGVGVIKTIAEVAYGKTAFPDITKQRTIRDRAEFAADSLGLGDVYRFARGRPTKGVGSVLSNLVMYNASPLEVAYFDATAIKFDWLNKKKGTTGNPTYSPQANALYYLKQSIRHGDADGMAKYMQEYADFEDSSKASIKKSITEMHPLKGGLTEKQEKEFKATLTEEQKKLFERAEKFWEDVLKSEDYKSLPAYAGMKSK